MSDYIQLAAIIGHPEFNNKTVKDDFYTLCQKNPNENKGLRKKSQQKHGEIIFKTSDTTIDYLCSDFARFCLALYKNSQNLVHKEMSLIPKQPFPISQELKDYIESYLPDYYGIR